MGNIKYIPMVVSGLTFLLILLAWQPLYEIFLFWFGVPPSIALAASFMLISIPILFLLGLGTNKKQFLIAAAFVGVAIILLVIAL